MKILFIAPIPPPITGQSLASKVLADELSRTNDIKIINLSKKDLNNGGGGLKRLKEVFCLFFNICKNINSTNILYLTLSESFAGNIKDIFIYILTFKLRSKTFIHLHGGSIKQELWDQNFILYFINKYFIKKFAGVILLSKSHKSIFQSFVPESKIHIVQNFAEDYLFETDENIRKKFNQIENFKILFMSNLMKQKGYFELAESVKLLPYKIQQCIEIHFAGSFESKIAEDEFLKKFNEVKQIKYHGVVNGERKKQLFSQCHFFCLPTSYLEGQPISILEAYASGCVVLTTTPSGIADIFKHKINGFKIDSRDKYSISTTIVEAFENSSNLKNIALINNDLAKKEYTLQKFKCNFAKIFHDRKL
jgi:glycosyltransferase involved in cell wall biosynthesis